MDEMKNCPFCGDDSPTLCSKLGQYGKFGWVECELCGARTKAFQVHGSEKSCGDEYWKQKGFKRAIDLWNRRTEKAEE